MFPLRPEMTGSVFSFLILLFVSESRSLQLTTENIVINVTTGTLSDNQLLDSNDIQIHLNVSVGEEQLLVNDIPVERSGVTRFRGQALLLDNSNGSHLFESGDLVSIVTRVMVNQNRLYGDSDEVVALQVFSQVIEMEGKEVQQPDMCEVKMLMSSDFQKLAQFTNIYPIRHSEIFRIPRENDVVATDPTDYRTDDEQLMSQTTSQYPHSETTQEEIAAPGKLPETPLYSDPILLSDELGDGDQIQPAHNQMETPPKEAVTPYSAMCRWVEWASEGLRHFCSESLLVFIQVMCIVVIGVVASAYIIKLLDLFFPTREQKHKCHVNFITVMPEEEKHNLLENMDLEAAGEEKNP